MPLEITYRDSDRDKLIRDFYAQLIETGQIEWHCRRHGVIRNVAPSLRNFVDECIKYHNGARSAWWDRDGNVEFFNNTKVYPPATKPWGWCGTTVIFGGWKQNIENARQFALGDRVQFEYKGETFIGFVAGATDRVSIIVPNNGKYYIPADKVTRV